MLARMLPLCLWPDPILSQIHCPSHRMILTAALIQGSFQSNFDSIIGVLQAKLLEELTAHGITAKYNEISAALREQYCCCCCCACRCRLKNCNDDTIWAFISKRIPIGILKHLAFTSTSRIESSPLIKAHRRISLSVGTVSKLAVNRGWADAEMRLAAIGVRATVNP
jgi:hypothetical protein